MDNIDDTENYMIKKTSSHRRCARCITGMHIPRRRMDPSTDRYCTRSSGTMANSGIHSTPSRNCSPFRFRTIHLSQVFGIYRKCLASSPLANTRDLLVEYDYPNLIAMRSRGPIEQATWKRHSKILSVPIQRFHTDI
jgi:hypothetical protein